MIRLGAVFRRIWNHEQREPVWWVNMLLGAFLGALVPLAPDIIKYLNKIGRTSAIEGRWNAYHVTTRGNKHIVVHSLVQIERDITKAYSVDLKEDVEEKLLYEGSIKEDGSDFLFSLDSREHEETVMVRLPQPLGTSASLLHGLWLAHDHERTIACGAIIISKDPIKEEEISRTMLGGIERTGSYDDKAPILRLNRR